MSQVPPQHPVAVDPKQRSAKQDDMHLTLLMVFYYVLAGLSAIGVCGGAVYIVLGFTFAGGTAQQSDPNAPPAFLGAIFGVIGGVIVILSLGVALLQALTAYGISRRKWRPLIYVTAAITCLSIPLGTALGIYTFIAMARPGVMAMFDAVREAASNDD